MPFFPPLTAMLSSASTDLAKTWLGRKGWPEAFKFLRQNNIAPTSGWGKNLSASVLILINCFVDWYHSEETPAKRFTKDILKDIPSEYMERMANVTITPADANAQGHNPIFSLTPEERTKLLACIRTLDQPTQDRLRELVNGLDAETLKTLAATDAVDMVTLLDLLMPAVPPKPHSQAPSAWVNDRLEAAANFLVPRLGR
jgi:hypothetical protein